MSLAKIAIEKRAVTYFTTVLILLAGLASYFSLGQLEDPVFTVKTAVITTQYPGASPEEVELEVTDRIELAMQEMKSLDYLESTSAAGLSIVKVNIKAEYWADRLPQEWDTLRRKIRDIETSFPPGVQRPIVTDDFGDVFGLLLAITSDGYSYSELQNYVDEIKKELSLVDGIARVDLWGEQQEIIYLDVQQSQLAQLKISEQSIQQTLQLQNQVVDAGRVDLQNRRLRIAPSGEFKSAEDISNLAIRPSFQDSVLAGSSVGGLAQNEELTRVGDIGTIRRGYLDPPRTLMRYNGLPSVSIALTNVPGRNMVDIGKAVDARLLELEAELPIGIEIHRVHWQSDVVDEAVTGFLISLAEAVAIVLIVLAIAMGWQMGIIIGTALIFTILMTFIVMAILDIPLQRMSLGALVIALGMMVDNAIVVAEGFVVRVQQGMNKKEAAITAANLPSWPLLGATVVAVMAFYPIFASVEDVGEYCRTLFTVVAISLLSSWVISMTLTPIQCIDMLSEEKLRQKGSSEGGMYSGKFYTSFRTLLEKAIKIRWVTMSALVGLLIFSGVGFGGVKQLFFPDSAMPKFMIDYWAPEGTRIQDVSAAMARIEKKLLQDDRISGVGSFIGSGPPRFYLPVEPEPINPAYGQLVVNVHDYKTVRDLQKELNTWVKATFPDALVPVRVFGVGPSNTWKFELRITGPSNASSDDLRGLAHKVTDILQASPIVEAYETDWRQRMVTVVPEYNQERGRWSAISREDIANTTKRAFDGRKIGLYREDDTLIPIVLRHIEEERQNVSGMDVLQIDSSSTSSKIPLAQVVDGISTKWDDSMIVRRDRKRTITVQANPIIGVTLPTLQASIIDQIQSIDLPVGYSFTWGGETESTADAQASLVPGVIPTIAVILLTIVVLFNAFLPPLIIILTIPFAFIGITWGLLFTGTPFGFLALLGAMSLVGMMIKNAIVLLDEVNINLENGMEKYEAVIVAALSRLRPVVLAAGTTVLGVIPLLQDVFWIGMAVTVMAGLAFGTVLTMIIIPVLYAIFFRLEPA